MQGFYRWARWAGLATVWDAGGAMASGIGQGNNIGGGVLSAPPAHYAQPLKKEAAEAVQKTGPDERVTLPALSPSFRKKVAGRNEDAAIGKRTLMLGAARAIAPEQQVFNLPSLTWALSPDGSRQVTRIDVQSPGAEALRVAYVWHGAADGVVVRFAAGGQLIERVDAAKLVATGGRESWGPVLEGDTATLEIDIPAGTVPPSSLTLTRVSHLLVGGRALYDRTLQDKMLRRSDDNSDIGRSGACEVDLACQTDAALDDAARAVGKLVFTREDGSTYLCSGTLLNNTGGQPVPYLFTARHCVETAQEAASLNVYWNFRAGTCGGGTAPSVQQQTGGARLLASSPDWDWALLQLNEAPPVSVTYAAWTSQQPIVQTAGIGLHYPQGDLLKRSDAFIDRLYDSAALGSSFIELYWKKGAIEQGSDGSPLLTGNSKGYYEVRGGLMYGYASCLPDNAPALPPNYYSRLDRMVPFVREYLAPNQAAPADVVMVVEFYHRGLDHYFMSANPAEIDLLDRGVISGWERTGLRFFAYDKPVGGASPVCRYYLRPEAGNSHFYSASPAECAEVGRRFANDWIFESGSVFYIPVPDMQTGNCPVDTKPIWRFFHETNTNHRYTAEVSVRDTLRVTPGWVAEGYGPDSVIMCTPQP